MRSSPPANVEGLGPFAERTFLGGTLGEATGGGRVALPPGTIVAERAVEAAVPKSTHHSGFKPHDLAE